MRRIIARRGRPGDAVLHVDERRPLGADEVASGVLAFPLTNDRREVVMWFRPELVRQVDWGGDPHNAKLAAEEGDHVRLSPRKSFELWRETVRGRSEPWHESDVRAATRFTRHLTSGLLRRQRHHAEVASDLQRVMRPSTIPPVPGWSFDVHDEPAGAGPDRRRLVRRVRRRRRAHRRRRRRRRRPRPAGRGRDGPAAQQPARLPARRPGARPAPSNGSTC